MVTSSADSGPGTLRQALTDAAANGNSVTDNITFNLPAGQQTISVLTALPAITSSVIIDGSTQPGAAITPNGAKITLIGPGSGTQFNCFEIHDADYVEIYGFVIKEFHFILSNGYLTGSAAIAMMGTSSRIIIGAPDKGNVMYDNGTGIANAPVAGYNPNVAYCEIKNNYIGMMEDGVSFNSNEGDAVVLSYTHRAQIGGNTAAEGNAFYGNFTISPYFDGTSNALVNNIFGASAGYLTPSNFNSTNTQVYLSSNISNAAQPSTFLVSNNVFATMLAASGFTNIRLTIQSNIWGESPTGKISLPIPGPAISLTKLTGTILIGGSDNSYANKITNTVLNPANITAKDAMIEVTESTKVELSHNSIFCNSNSNNNPPFEYMNTDRVNQPITITLDAVTGSSVSGTTKPNARVEVFYTDKECSGCEPEKYIASVNADASGNWVYNGSINPDFNVIASATLNNMSSEFSNPDMDISGIDVQPVSCSALGSITGIKVANAHVAQWYNANGQPAGPPGPDLIDVEPGSYYLVLNQFGCSYKSSTFIILDKRPVLDQSGLNTTNAICGLANGSITGLKAQNYQSIQWLDANGNAVPNGTDIDLTGVPAGTYTLRLFGPACYTDFSPFTIGDTKDIITISAASEQVTPDQCGQSQGSIKGITIIGGITPFSYSWTDANGKIVSTDADATGLPAGMYTLTVTDASCGKASQSFNITNETETVNPPQANNVKVCGNAAVLKVNNVQNGYTYKLYSDDVSTIPLQMESSGMFKVISTSVTNYYLSAALGTCESGRIQVTVTHGNDFGDIPNTFTPNGDGVNDNWELDGLVAYPQAEVQVFNRYGQQVYYSRGYSVPWDGTYKGSPLPAGTYYYIINLGNNVCRILSGYVAILH